MNTFARKHQDQHRHRHATAANYSESTSDGRATEHLTGNRPAAMAHRVLQKSVNGNPRVQSQLRLRQSLEASPRVVALATLAATMSGRSSTLQPTVQMVRVYTGATRLPVAGFDEDAMYAEFSKNKKALALESRMGDLGFRYVGDTASASKANTDVTAKTIRINKSLTPEVAALSLAYELTNASQTDEFQAAFQFPGSDIGSPERAKEYAERIMRLESRSILMRSEVALSMGRGHLIVNQKYNEIAGNSELSEQEKVDQIFTEMKEHGTVNRGAKKVYDHYVEQFWQLNSQSIHGLD